MEATLWEAFGYMDINQLEARKVHHLVEMAQAQRAVWMADVNLAVYGGEGLKRRTQELTAAFRRDDAEEVDLKRLADSVPGKAGEEMRKRLAYVEFCRAHGLEV